MIPTRTQRLARAALCAAAILCQCASAGSGAPELRDPRETHLEDVRQLTFGGENAEAYFSADGAWLVFQSTPERGRGCDQIYIMRTDGTGRRRVSNGTGRTTCGYFFPGGDRLLFSSTHVAAESCPPPPNRTRGYVWPLYASYDIFSVRRDGSRVRRLTSTPGYDAEATVSPDGRSIVFTSVRDGDLDIYAMDPDGGNVRRLTKRIGYDGGAFFSADGRRIVYRAHHPADPADVADYRALLQAGLVRPGRLEIFVMDGDGANQRQVTHDGVASFAPFFHPDGRRIIYASNRDDPKGRNFEIYLVSDEGTGLERITYNPTFDGFPMFSPDGRRLVFASNRNARRPGETNVFIADWVE